MPAVDGFQIYSEDGSLHWMTNFMARMGETKLLRFCMDSCDV